MESGRGASEGGDGGQQDGQHHSVRLPGALLYQVSQHQDHNPLTQIPINPEFGNSLPRLQPPPQSALLAHHFQQVAQGPTHPAATAFQFQPNAYTGWVSPAYRQAAASPAPAGPFQLPSSTGQYAHTTMIPQRVPAMTPSFSLQYQQQSTPMAQMLQPQSFDTTSASSQQLQTSIECEATPKSTRKLKQKARERGAKTLPTFRPLRSDSVLDSSPYPEPLPRPSLRKTLPATGPNAKPAIRQCIESNPEAAPPANPRRSDATLNSTGRKVAGSNHLDGPLLDGASAANVNLNSAEETKLPDFIFCDLDKHDSDIHVFRCPNPLELCIRSKRFLINKYSNNPEIPQDFLRMDSQNLHDIDPRQPAHAVLLTNALHNKVNPDLPIAILTVFINGDKNLRTFYTAFKLQPWLDELADAECISEIVASLEPRTAKHKRLFVFLRQTFENAVRIPHHADYSKAEQMTDWSAPIMNPKYALKRLEKHEPYYFHQKAAKGPELNLEDDRYLLELHPAERMIAADVKVRCSKYLLIKRQFFKAFWDEMVKQKEKIGDGRKRVRTDAAHETWLQTEYAWKVARIRTLVNGWKVLGLLDEKRYLEHLNAGGAFEGDVEEDDEEVTSEGGRPTDRRKTDSCQDDVGVV